MAYQTGTVANSAALKTVIKDFGVANGWTLTGEFLSKGDISVKFDTTFQYQIFQNTPYNGANSIGLYITGASTLPGYTVNGYGIYVGDTITLSGAVPTAYNGVYTVSAINTPVGSVWQFVTLTVLSGTSFSSNPGNFTTNPTITGEFGTIFMFGATSADGATNYLNQGKGIAVLKTYWPLTYHLSANTNPDIIVCTLVYNINECQTLIFGNIKKIHDSAFTGGGFYFGTHRLWYGVNGIYTLADNSLLSYGYSSPLPFIPYTPNSGINIGSSECLHAELDGVVWATRDYGCVLGLTNVCNLARSPNTYNSQTHLVPVSIYLQYASGYRGYLGQLEHIRYLRNDNYEVGDIITIGTDKWKVFPAWKKSITNRSGGSTANSGTLAYAVRYDGP